MRPGALRAVPVAVRYAMVSGLCLVTHNAIMILTDALGLALLVGVGLSFGLVNSLAYVLHCRFTYAATSGWRAYAGYLALMAANTPLATASLWLFAKALVWPMAVAAPVASCCMIAINFLSSRLAIGGRRVGSVGSLP